MELQLISYCCIEECALCGIGLFNSFRDSDVPGTAGHAHRCEGVLYDKVIVLTCHKKGVAVRQLASGCHDNTL